MYISKIKTSSKVNSVDALIKQCTVHYEQSELTTDTYLPQLMAELSELSSEMTAALTRGGVESTLAEKDDIRDGAVQGLYHLLNGATYHPNPSIKNGAETILKQFDVDMVRMSYGAESSMIDTLLETINSDEIKPVAESIPGAASLITAVTEAQKDFAETAMQYQTAKGELKTITAPSVVKKKILTHFNGTIVIYLRAMAIVDEPKFGAFCRTIAEMIDSCNRS